MQAPEGWLPTPGRLVCASQPAARGRRHAARIPCLAPGVSVCSLPHPVRSPRERPVAFTAIPSSGSSPEVRVPLVAAECCVGSHRSAFARAAKGTRVPLPVIHVAAYTPGVVVAACFAVRYVCDAFLRLVAGLVVIFGRDERSRASRALAVLRAIPWPGKRRLCRALASKTSLAARPEALCCGCIKDPATWSLLPRIPPGKLSVPRLRDA
jgi:hypothetical protein